MSSGFAGFPSLEHPLAFIEELIELKPDRVFARASDRMMTFLEQRPTVFKEALSLLHPGAFKSFKKSRYPEGNAQLSFARIENSTELKVDCDIDLFASPVAHFFLEVLPNDVFNPPSTTDPRRAYAMRWMSAQRRLPSDPTAKFDPPFTLALG